MCGLFVIFRPTRKFHSFGDVRIAGEGLQILTFARHLRQLSSESSLAWHTYCDTGHPFIMVISENPWRSLLMPSACDSEPELSLPVLTTGLSRLDSNIQSSACGANLMCGLGWLIWICFAKYRDYVIRINSTSMTPWKWP